MNLLNVHINNHEIIASIADMREKKVEGLFHHDFSNGLIWNEIDQLFATFYKKHQNHFYKVDKAAIFWHTEYFSIIPSSFYKEKETEALLKIHHGLLPEGDYVYDAVRPANVGVAYALPFKLKSVLNQYFNNNTINHAASALIQSTCALPNPLMHLEMYIMVHNKHFELLIRKGFELILYNQFLYELPEDILYHSLNICEQFKFNKDQIHIIIGGNIAKQSPIVELQEQYFANVRMAVRPSQFSYSEVIENLPAHFYHSIFQSFLCV
jgi:hypothetical protein